jgi:outer membrane protein
LLLIPVSLSAADLKTVFNLASRSDPQFKAAVADYHATIEVRPQTRALLLPDLSLSSNITRTRFDPKDNSEVTYATNKTYSVQLRQTLLSLDRYHQYRQSENLVDAASAALVSAEQELIMRAATRYFAVLGAQDNLTFVNADLTAIRRTLEQANKRHEVGLSAITDVHEARARHDVAVSNRIEAGNELDDAREALQELTGQPEQALNKLTDTIPLNSPDPESMQTWVDTALKQNPELLAAIAAAESAQRDIKVQRAGHFPTLDLTADYTRLDTNFGGVILIERDDSSVGLELRIPLFQGGVVNSRTRESRQKLVSALENQELQRRRVKRQTRDNYRGVITGISRVKALMQAVKSNKTALEAATIGYEVGTRTTVDVLDAQRELLKSRRDHARARYDYLLDTLRLKQSAGILVAQDIGQLNELLE